MKAVSSSSVSRDTRSTPWSTWTRAIARASPTGSKQPTDGSISRIPPAVMGSWWAAFRQQSEDRLVETTAISDSAKKGESSHDQARLPDPELHLSGRGSRAAVRDRGRAGEG